MIIDDFRSWNGKNIDPSYLRNGSGYTIVGILPELTGCKVDSTLISLCSALGATSIRITEGICTCNCKTGRVTVYIDDNDIIQNIKMEIRFNPPIDNDNIHCGADMSSHIKKLKEVK